jgi:hypothetical protein
MRLVFMAFSLTAEIAEHLGAIAGEVVQFHNLHPGHAVSGTGSNEPDRFSESYLDKGTRGSLLMAFPARE